MQNSSPPFKLIDVKCSILANTLWAFSVLPNMTSLKKWDRQISGRSFDFRAIGVQEYVESGNRR